MAPLTQQYQKAGTRKSLSGMWGFSPSLPLFLLSIPMNLHLRVFLPVQLSTHFPSAYPSPSLILFPFLLSPFSLFSMPMNLQLRLFLPIHITFSGIKSICKKQRALGETDGGTNGHGKESLSWV